MSLTKSALSYLALVTVAAVLGGCQASNFPTTGSMTGLTNSSSSTSSTGGSTRTTVPTGTLACTSKGYYSVRTQCETASNQTCTATVVDYGDQDYICWKARASSSSSSTSSTPAGTWTTGEWSACVNRSQNREVFCPSGSCAGTRPVSTQACVGNIFGALHTDTQCESLYATTQSANGEIITSWGSVRNVEGHRVCAIPVPYKDAFAQTTTCPSGWTPYRAGNIHFTITSEVLAQEASSGSCRRFQMHSTGGHATLTAVPRGEESLILCTDRKCGFGSLFSYGCKRTDFFISRLLAVGCY